MTDETFVNLDDRARLAISLGESHFREFKSALHGPPGQKTPRDPKSICKDIGEALVAFANADGGELLVGVEDNCEVTGIDCFNSSRVETFEQAVITQVHAKTPLPKVRLANIALDGRRVLYFSVFKSTKFVHLTADGRCLQRRDLETVPIPAEEILLDRKERESRTYDREFVDGATVNDLDPGLIGIVADRLSRGMSVEKCLQHLELAEYAGPGLRLRRGALLLFAMRPQDWHPRLQIRIIKVSGTNLGSGPTYNVKSDQTVSGNILELVEKGWESLRPQLVQTKLGAGARFESTVMYPELACREALVNSIAHRDYSEEGRAIEIFVFDDRMEVRNPGALLSSISLDSLLKLDGRHQSRNAICARVLREVGYMQELGEGLRRMFELMRVNELTPPQLTTDGNSFCVTLRHNTIYTPAQQLWLGQFESFGLTREQKAIVVLGMGGGPISPQDIWDSLGIVDTEHYRQLVRSLQEMNLLTSAISKTQAQEQARRRRIPVRSIPRFVIGVPKRVDSATTRTGHMNVPVRSVSPRKERSPDTKPPSAGSDDVSEAPGPSCQVFLGNVDFSTSDADLLEFASQFAEIQSLYVPRDENGKGKGYAFLGFDSTETAMRVMAQLDGHFFRGRPLAARKANAQVSERRKGTPRAR